VIKPKTVKSIAKKQLNKFTTVARVHN